MSEAESSPQTNPPTILVVEDNALVAKFYRMALERAGGFACLVTENMQEILAAVEAGRIHLAILDVSLSDTVWEGQQMDGVKLAKLLRERSPRKLPILLATAHAMAGDRERLLAASGADDYLEKPVYDIQQLVEKVRRLLEQNEDSPFRSEAAAPPGPGNVRLSIHPRWSSPK